MEDELYFDRDEKGNLIPQKFIIEVNESKEEVYLIPLTRGELKRFFSGVEEEFDDYILLNKVIKPNYTEDEISYDLKPEYAEVLVNKVFEISGVSSKKNNRKKRFEEEDDFGKKLREVRERRDEGNMMLFLHELGYNFNTINSLTISEINWIISCFNAREDKKKLESKGFSTK